MGLSVFKVPSKVAEMEVVSEFERMAEIECILSTHMCTH